MTEDEKVLLQVAKIESALDKKLQRRPNAAVQVMNFAGGLSGLLALAALVSYGGEMHRQIQVDSKRIDSLEASGSPLLREHVRVLQSEVDARKEADVVANVRLNDLRLDYAQRIAAISALLEKMTEQQTQLIAMLRAQNKVASTRP